MERTALCFCSDLVVTWYRVKFSAIAAKIALYFFSSLVATDVSQSEAI